jgi:hypothetical protein
MTKCVSCRKETEYIIGVGGILKCKFCKRKAQPGLAISKCKHQFSMNGCTNCGSKFDKEIIDKQMEYFNKLKEQQEMMSKMQENMNKAQNSLKDVNNCSTLDINNVPTITLD